MKTATEAKAAMIASQNNKIKKQFEQISIDIEFELTIGSPDGSGDIMVNDLFECNREALNKLGYKVREESMGASKGKWEISW